MDKHTAYRAEFMNTLMVITHGLMYIISEHILYSCTEQDLAYGVGSHMGLLNDGAQSQHPSIPTRAQACLIVV